MELEKGKRVQLLSRAASLKLSGYKEIREECTHSSVQNVRRKLLIENGSNATISGDYGARARLLRLTDDSGNSVCKTAQTSHP